MSGPIHQHGGIEMRDHRAGEPTPLTTSQKSRLRREFRAAYLIDNETPRRVWGSYSKRRRIRPRHRNRDKVVRIGCAGNGAFAPVRLALTS